MRNLVHESTTLVNGPDGTVYAPRVLGLDRRDGTWEGWIEFYPLRGDFEGIAPVRTHVLATERETTQPSRQALEYWAAGLEPVYFEGAFARAVSVRVRSARATRASLEGTLVGR